MSRPNDRSKRRGRHSEPGSTSSGLIKGAKANDPQSWDQLVQQYTPLVKHWCGLLGVAKDEIPDLVQEVFASASRTMQTYDHDSFRGWIWTITKNKVRDLSRKRGRQVHAIGGSEAADAFMQIPEPSWLRDPSDPGTVLPKADSTHDRALLDAIRNVRDEFNETTWRAFYLTAIENAHTDDVAAELGMTPNAVYKAKYRVLARLKKQFGNKSS